MIKYRSSILVCLPWLILCSLSLRAETPSFNPVRVGGSIESLHGGSITDAEIGFQLVFNEILSKVDTSFTVKIYDNDEILVDKFKKGEVQSLFINTLRFLEIENLIHPTARYVVQYGSSIKQRYLLLVRNSDKPFSLENFRNRKLSISIADQVGLRFLNVELLEHGLPEADFFFSQVDETKDANTAIVDLYFHNTDLALVPEYSYLLAQELNPQIGKALSLLIQSEPMIYQVVGMSKDFPPDKIERYEPYLLTDTPSDRLKEVLRSFRIVRLHRVDDDTLKEVKDLNERYSAISGHLP